MDLTNRIVSNINEFLAYKSNGALCIVQTPLIWSYYNGTKKLRVNEPELREELAKCTSRFILMTLILIDNSGIFINSLLYDSIDNRLGRFNLNKMGYIDPMDTINLDNALQYELQKFINIITYHPPQLLPCPCELQIIGYCNLWTLWYMVLRILNPEVDKSILSPYVYDNKNKPEFNNFVNDYIKFLSR
jgi:hypothetical protein